MRVLSWSAFLGALFVALAAGCRPGPPPAPLSTGGAPAPPAAAAPPAPQAWRCLYQGGDGVYAVAAGGGATPELLQTLPADTEIAACAVCPDQSEIALSVYDGPCLVKNLRSGVATTVVGDRDEAGEVAWSPDGRALAFGKNGHLWVSRAGAQQQLCSQTRVTSLAWSPDGSLLAFACRDNSDQDRGLWLVPATGGTPRRLAPPTGEVYSPDEIHWSPDGRWIAFGHAWEGAVLAFVRPDGTGYRAQVDTISWPLVWRQDSSAVLYQAMADEMTSRGVRSCAPQGKPQPVLDGPPSATYDVLPTGTILVVNNPGSAQGPGQVLVSLVPGGGAGGSPAPAQALAGDSAEGSLAPDGSAVAVVVEAGEKHDLYVGRAGGPLSLRGPGRRVLGWVR